MEYALHSGRWPWHLEKWYFDTLTPGGDVLIVLLAGIRVCGLWRGRVTAELYPAGCAPIRGDAAAARVEGGPDRLCFGPARIDGERFTFETPGLSGDLRVVPRFPPATARDPLFSVGATRLGWTMEVPDADTSGELRWPGGSLALQGRGYRDRVWTDILPWRIPLLTVRWGRAAAAEHATSWMDAETTAERFRTRWADGVFVASDPPALREGRTLFSMRVADMEALSLGALGSVLRRMTDPHQTRWAARATLDGCEGWAVHEEVRWR